MFYKKFIKRNRQIFANRRKYFIAIYSSYFLLIYFISNSPAFF